MSMLYLTEQHVRDLLPMPECIGLIETVFARLAAGEALNQPRRRLILPTGSLLHYMAGSDGQYYGAKIYATNPRRGAHFLFLLYRAADAEPLAIIEANHLGQIRTGAASGLATKFMAHADAATLAIIGSGFQARTQLEAMLAVRNITDVRVWSRNSANRAVFAAETTERFGIPIQAAESAEQAVRGAQIVVTATYAKEPVLSAEWIAPGTHINAMGSNQATRREIPADLVRRADTIAVDSIEQARMESGDLLLAMDEKDWASPRIVELKDVVTGRAPTRTQPEQVTLFKSNGLAVEDVIAAAFVYERARAAGLGIAIPHS
ncbi:MAG TPA: ornithine cyclodeaminase family protein [Bryobacteraceae bacterium]|jgi:ornithine cyclodeaminase/alanine dehydrogenase-like protein (mu-crystallin family)|nr:ornithine cyclodeaminase family protein [Bryobacteraceae bacterium]